MKILLIIPAYNEEENIETVVKEWHEVVEKYGIDNTNEEVRDSIVDIFSTYSMEEKLLLLPKHL